jgi:alkylation response protein AidB-like acyl-CoA dehydrogenase
VDFSLSEAQQAVADSARQLFEGLATVERVRAVEISGAGIDRELWGRLAEANLLGVAVPEHDGGSGLGLVELCVLLEQQGRRVAPVPLLPTLVMGALAVAEWGTAGQRAALLPGVVSGDVVLTAAMADGTVADTADHLTGHQAVVPAAALSNAVVVQAMSAEGSRLYLVDPQGPGVTIDPVVTTDRQPHAHLSLDGAQGDALGGAGGPEWLRERMAVAWCAVQVGVCEEALAMAAAYTSTRNQFGRPLSTNQGVAMRAADAYIDVEAMRVTMLQAAWRLAVGRQARDEVEVAAWWAAAGGHRVVHATQHLHGGMGADVEYPAHRYFLWGKQIQLALGGAGPRLAQLGDRLAEAAP